MTRILPLALVLTITCTVHADNWPQWRGANHDGISTATNVPVKWTATENVAWKLPMPGMGGSTPIVWNDRLFLTSDDGPDVVLLCVNSAGKEVWKYKLGSKRPIVRTDEGNGASASPCTDGKHVWAFAGSGELACLDLDGKEIWKFNLQDRYGRFKIMFGMHSTPVLHENRLYLQLIHSGGAQVIALEKATGEEVWKVKRPSDGRDECEHSYASPCLWQNGKDALLITHGNDYAIAHQLTDGKEIWRVGELNPKAKYDNTLRFVASPVAVKDLIVVPSAKNGPVVGVKPDAKGLVLPGGEGEVWRRTSNTPDVPSPLVHEGLVYLCRENGVLFCLEAKTGKELYNERLHNARYRASPVYADGKIFCTSRDGFISVVQAGPKYKQLAENRLPDEISASPAIVNGRIYVRGFKTLYAIGGQ